MGHRLQGAEAPTRFEDEDMKQTGWFVKKVDLSSNNGAVAR
jgi:hypothetical protein